MALKQEDIAKLCENALRDAEDAGYQERVQNNEKALNYYFNATRGDEIPGRSKVQSTDVSDMVEAVLSNIGPILTSETLIQFEAAGEEDEPQAQMESDFCAYMVTGQNEGYLEMVSAIKDALLLKNGWVTVWVEQEDYENSFTRDGLAEHQIEAIVNESDQERRIVVDEVERDGEAFNVSFREIIRKRRFRTQSVDPADLRWQLQHNSQDISTINFLAERRVMTRSELLKMDYPASQIDELPAYHGDTSPEKTARKPNQQTRDHQDKSQENIETWIMHIQMDSDEDGIAELHRIHYAEKEILSDEIVEFIPYATGSPFIIPHRLEGESIYDKLKQIQDSKTDMYRQWHDNVRLCTHGRLVFDPLETNENDVKHAGPGRGIKSKNPTNTVYLQTPDVGPAILSALEYMDRQRSERGGASLDLSSAQMQLAGQVGDQGAERQISIKEQLAAQMSATLAHTLVRNTYLLAHRTLREYSPGELTAKLNGKWVRTDPSQWPERKKANVVTGLSQGEKLSRLSALRQVIAAQIDIYSQGKDRELVDDGNVYNALMDFARAANLENPEQYWVDPDSDPAKRARREKEQQQQQQQQAQLQALQAQQQTQNQVFYLQQQLEKYKHDTDLVFKYFSERLKSEIEEAKLIGSATVELERLQAEFERAGQAQAAATDG